MLEPISQAENTSIFHPGSVTLSSFATNTRSELYAREDYQRSLLNFFDEFAEDGGKLLSFDVFDTVLLRNEKSELRRFLEMAERFSDAACAAYDVSCEAAGVLYARLLATQIAYRFSKPIRGCREGTLAEIHTGIVRMLGLPDAFAEKLTALELEYETENLTPNPALPAILDCAAEAAVDVVLISDMYMSNSQIAQLLNAHFPGTFRQRQIFSSGDLKISKRSGFLFDHVAAELRVDPATALHVGDNLTTDYISPRAQGWQALYLPHSDREHRAIEIDEGRVHNELRARGVDLKKLFQD